MIIGWTFYREIKKRTKKNHFLNDLNYYIVETKSDCKEVLDPI